MSKPLIFFASLLFLFSGSALIYFAVNGFKQAVQSGGDETTPAQIEAVLSNGEPITEFTLTERSGRSFHSTELDGEVCIASFFFATCPGRCMQQNHKVAQLQREFLDRGIRLVSITVDPANDTPSQLVTYANGFAADPEQWLFLTGEMDSIRRIGKDIFNVPLETYTHTEKLFAIDRDGHIRGRYSWQDDESFRELRKLIDVMLDEKPGATAPTLDAAEEPDADNSPPE